MKILRKIQKYINKQYQMLKNNRAEVERSNTQLAYAILIMGCFAFIPFIVISFTVPNYFSLRNAYLIAFFGLFLILLVFKIFSRYLSFATIIYATYSLLIAYAIYTSSFITPDYISVIILLFLFQLPIIVIDKSWRVNLVTILYATCYLCLAIPYKQAYLVSDEILNCLLFTMLGIGLGEILRYTRLENFELKRLVVISEKIDDLTGLYNRKSLFDHLNVIANQTPDTSVGLLLMDIDYFKIFNDTYGHQQGDRCLKQIGQCFIAFGEAHSMKFFRYGGEEFVAVTTNIDAQELVAVAKMLNQAIFDLQIPHINTAQHFVSLSIGVDVAQSSLPGYEGRLLSQADTAMYQAKSQGRNCTVLFQSGMSMQTL